MTKTLFLAIGLAALLAEPPARADEHKLGEHPAIIAARVYAAQGYDYASKFYPHPAWLYLLPEAPPGARAAPSAEAPPRAGARAGARGARGVPPRRAPRRSD